MKLPRSEAGKPRKPRAGSTLGLETQVETTNIPWPEFKRQLREAFYADEFEVGNELAGYRHESALSLAEAYALLYPQLKPKILAEFDLELQVKEAQRSLKNTDPFFAGRVVGFIPMSRQHLKLSATNLPELIRSAQDDSHIRERAGRLSVHWNQAEAILGVARMFPQEMSELRQFQDFLLKELDRQNQIDGFLRVGSALCLMFPEYQRIVREKLSEKFGDQKPKQTHIQGAARLKIILGDVRLQSDGSFEVNEDASKLRKTPSLPERSSLA